MEGKIYKTYGDGSEFLENLMNDPQKVPRISEWELYGKYLEEYDRYAETGMQSSEAEVQRVYNRLMETIQLQCKPLDKAFEYKKKLDESWPLAQACLMKNPARVHYWNDWVVRSISFYDAMRRILDPNIPNSTVMEASKGVTFDIAGKYGPLDPRRDVSVQFDTFLPIMASPRERAFIAAMNAIKADKILSIGCGCFPYFRQYGYPLWRIKQQHIVGIDLERPRELDQMFMYDRGVDFAGTGIEFMQGEAIDVLERWIKERPDVLGYFGMSDLLGVLSYCKTDEDAIRLLSLVKKVVQRHGLVVLDLQILDDVKDAEGRIIMQGSLKFVSKMFVWSENMKLRPEPSVAAARQRVQNWCKKVGCKVALELVDARNTTPVQVTYVLEMEDGAPEVPETVTVAKTDTDAEPTA